MKRNDRSERCGGPTGKKKIRPTLNHNELPAAVKEGAI